MLVKTKSPCNAPIFSLKKETSADYCLVYDESETPVVSDPHTLLSNIPSDAGWYKMIDLCSDFFSVPLHLDSQYLFALTFQGEQNTYTWLPQVYVDSPSIFNRMVDQDLQHLDSESTIIWYIDDIFVCSKTKVQFEKDSVALLTALATGGHNVSRDKLQFCPQKVEYLDRRLCKDKHKTASSQAVTKVPQPQTVGQTLSFLGMVKYSQPSTSIWTNT